MTGTSVMPSFRAAEARVAGDDDAVGANEDRIRPPEFHEC